MGTKLQKCHISQVLKGGFFQFVPGIIERLQSHISDSPRVSEFSQKHKNINFSTIFNLLSLFLGFSTIFLFQSMHIDLLSDESYGRNLRGVGSTSDNSRGNLCCSGHTVSASKPDVIEKPLKNVNAK